MQQIQQLSQTIQKNEELNRQKILQQQQAEFDQQIGHVSAPSITKFLIVYQQATELLKLVNNQ